MKLEDASPIEPVKMIETPQTTKTTTPTTSTPTPTSTTTTTTTTIETPPTDHFKHHHQLHPQQQRHSPTPTLPFFTPMAAFKLLVCASASLLLLAPMLSIVLANEYDQSFEADLIGYNSQTDNSVIGSSNSDDINNDIISHIRNHNHKHHHHYHHRYRHHGGDSNGDHKHRHHRYRHHRNREIDPDIKQEVWRHVDIEDSPTEGGSSSSSSNNNNNDIINSNSISENSFSTSQHSNVNDILLISPQEVSPSYALPPTNANDNDILLIDGGSNNNINNINDNDSSEKGTTTKSEMIFSSNNNIDDHVKYSKIIRGAPSLIVPFGSSSRKHWQDSGLTSIKIEQQESNDLEKGGWVSSVIAIMVGVTATGVLVLVVSHKLRSIKRKGRRRSLVPDTDFLINTFPI